MVVVFRTIVPLFVMIGLGFLIARYRTIDTSTLANLTIYILTPSLVFSKYLQYPVPIDQILKIIAFLGSLFTILWIAALVVACCLKLDRVMRHSFSLAVVLSNAGNVGIPFILFAFNDVGLSIAIIYLMVNIVLTNTFGVFIAAGANSNPLGAFKQIFLLPAIYTILVGIIIQRLGLVLPDYVIQPVNLLGEAAIPNSILLLGAQLARIKFNQDLKPTLIASFMRLILSAMIAFLLTLLFKFDGITQKVLILLPAMPSAVYSVILATKFDVRPEFPSGVILVSTIASAFTLAILLFMLS